MTVSITTTLAFKAFVRGMGVRAVVRSSSSARASTAAFSWDDAHGSTLEGYQLLDSGDGRKLEWIGGVIVERNCPVATWPRRKEIDQWKSLSTLRYRRNAPIDINDGDNATAEYHWSGLQNIPDEWILKWNSIRMKLEPSANGQQIGVFPEQSNNWRWIQSVLQKEFSARMKANDDSSGSLNIMNCFGYTGAATLAAAAVRNVQVFQNCLFLLYPSSDAQRCYQVTHVDASRHSIMMGQANAQLSNIDERWCLRP
jgi:23S rRNA (cytosine1962-C5)-methyltransferase